MSDPYTLNYLILDAGPRGALPIRIRRDATAHDLKLEIRKQNPGTFRYTDIRSIKLWKVSIPECDWNTIPSQPQDVGGAEEITWRSDPVSQIFSDGTFDRYLHIIVHTGIGE